MGKAAFNSFDAIKNKMIEIGFEYDDVNSRFYWANDTSKASYLTIVYTGTAGSGTEKVEYIDSHGTTRTLFSFTTTQYFYLQWFDLANGGIAMRFYGYNESNPYFIQGIMFAICPREGGFDYFAKVNNQIFYDNLSGSVTVAPVFGQTGIVDPSSLVQVVDLYDNQSGFITSAVKLAIITQSSQAKDLFQFTLGGKTYLCGMNLSSNTAVIAGAQICFEFTP